MLTKVDFYDLMGTSCNQKNNDINAQIFQFRHISE